MNEYKKIFHRSRNPKHIRIDIFISDKILFKPKTVTVDKWDYIMIKWLIHQENKSIHKYVYAQHDSVQIY